MEEDEINEGLEDEKDLKDMEEDELVEVPKVVDSYLTENS